MLRIILTREAGWPDHQPMADRMLEDMAAALRDAGQQVRVVTTALRPDHVSAGGIDVRYVRRHHRSSFGSGLGSHFGVQTLGRTVAARADVWHAMGLEDAAAAAALSTVRPGLCSVYTDHGFCEPDRLSPAESRMQALVARRIDHYVCVSHAAA